MKDSAPLVSLKNVEVNFGGKSLFVDLSMNIYRKDRVCLIGKNGEGKSTLMNLLYGVKEPTTGEVWTMPGIQIGFLSQSIEIATNITVNEYILTGLKAATEEQKHLVDIVVAPLDLDGAWILQNLSGGQKRRAALARALVMQPDLLLLDEPTNHLDISAIEWLEEFVTNYNGAVVTISHDRRFLANVSRSILWLDRGVLRQHKKGYSDFDDWSLKILEQEQRELNNLQRRVREEDDWLHGGVTARRKRNQRRLHELYAMREKLQTARAQLKQATAKINLDSLKSELSSKLVAEFRGVVKSYGDKKIIDDFSYRIMRGDKIGIIGANGSGKTTLLRMLVGQLQPDQGSVKLGKNLQVTYFDQSRVDLDPDKSLWETLCPSGGDRVMVAGNDMHVVAYLKKFLFDPKLAKTKVGILSGGQANRLLLARALASPGNVLILDEPTNDLDMDTLDLIEEVLMEYSGTLILVSHDRDFIDRIVTKSLVFEGESVIDEYIGGYTDYQNAKIAENKKTKSKQISKNQLSEITASKSQQTKLSFKLLYELEQLPSKIEQINEEVAYCEEMLADADLYQQDQLMFINLSQKLVLLKEQLAESELRWLHLMLLKDEASG